ASAGHNPPVLLPAQGAPSWLPPRREPVAGAMEGMTYTTDTLTLHPGDALFLYTDGVTEAMNHQEELYSDPRLMELLATLGGRAPKEMVSTVHASIKAFTGGAEQSDDITMVALRYLGRSDETR
ncbi:MAG: PP2C family protein-serine/threonine phosphatase, partial [Desulfovibrionaceae bacterium]